MEEGAVITVWDLKHNLQICRSTIVPGPCRSAALSQDGRRAIANANENVIIWNFDKSEQPRLLKGIPDNEIGFATRCQVTVTADGRLGASVTESRVTIWDLEQMCAIRVREG